MNFGLGGSDTFYSQLGADNQIFVGGEGGDTYKIEAPGFMTIYDGGLSGNDTILATGLGLQYSTTYAGTIDGQHLYAYDEYSGQGIIVVDYLDDSSKIESDAR